MPAGIKISSVQSQKSTVVSSRVVQNLIYFSALGWSPKSIPRRSPYFMNKRSSSCSTWAEKKQVGMLLELHTRAESDPAARRHFSQPGSVLAGWEQMLGCGWSAARGLGSMQLVNCTKAECPKLSGFYA